MESSEVDNTKSAAQKLLSEGNYLQSMEEFSKILVKHPNDQEALEGRLSACLELKLFHRCLNDIETLIETNPSGAKVHNLAGQIYEQIGAYEKSICAYLKAYLYEEKADYRLETVQKVTQLCYTLLGETHTEIPGKNIDCFERLVTLSQELAEKEKFQVCFEIIVTAIMSHCLDKSALEVFKRELDVGSRKDSIIRENISIEIPGIVVCTVEENRNMENAFEKFTKDATDTKRISKSEIELVTSSLQDKTKEKSSVLNALHSSYNASQASNEVENFNHGEDSDSVTKAPTQLSFLPNTDSQTINNMLLQASKCCYKLRQLKTSLWFAEKLLQNSKTSEDIVAVLKAYSQLGFLHTKCGDHNFGVLCYTEVRSKCRELLETKNTLEKAEEISAFERENILKLCLLCKDFELYEEAEEFLKEFFSKVDVVEQDSLVTAYGVLGDTELAQCRYDDAIKSFKTQLALCLEYNDQKGLVLAYSNLGKVYQASGKSTLSMPWLQLSLHTANTVNDSLSLATAYNNIGESLLFQNNPQQALPYFEKQLDLSTAIDKQSLRVQALFSIGKTYQDLRLFQHAEFFLRRALLEAKDVRMHLEKKIKESLVQVLVALGKYNEALKFLYEIRDRLESNFDRVSRYKIITSHPLLDNLNACVDQILEQLAEEERFEEALQLSERTNSILLNQMLAYKAYIQGSVFTKKCTNLSDLYQVVNDTNKVVLYYRVVRNGFMVWIIAPVTGMVHFYWYKAPISSPFKEMIQDVMNRLLQSTDQLASYTCDHRKVVNGSQTTQDTPQGLTSRSKCTSQDSSSRSPQRTVISKNTHKSSSKSSESPTSPKDCLRELSELLIFPIEEGLINVPDMNSRDLVIINNAFLSMIPFMDLHTSRGNTLADVANSLQRLPCVSVLRNLEQNEENSTKGISIIGNPEIKFPEILAGFQSHLQPDFLEKEINDVAIILGTVPDAGAFASKDQFLKIFSSCSLMHLSTYASHEQGTITLAPIADIDTRVVATGMARDSWEITLEDILAFRRAPEVIVLTSGYGCRNRFKELEAFNAYLPLAFMLTGVKTVVMATWSTPQNALLACLRQFYKNISEGLTVTCALARAKANVQKVEEFHEPLYWASFNVYGQDSLINLEKLRRNVAEKSFVKAQKMAVERFGLGRRNEESSDAVLSRHLIEAVIEFLHRHHLRPDFLPILLQVIQEARTILQTPPSRDVDDASLLPYREITPPWVRLIRSAEKFLLSVGFLIKTTNSEQNILVYPHWNQNDCLAKVELLLQSVLNVLTYSPILADALRAVLQQEEKSLLVSFRDVLQERLTSPYEIVEIRHNNLLRMLWLKRSTQRLMIQLSFKRMGDVLEFANSKDDRDAVESCLTIITLLIEFETSSQIHPHPMLSKANLGGSWMSSRVSDEENIARYFVARSMDSIDVKYKLAMRDLRKWHNDIFLTQAKIAETEAQKAKLGETKTSKLPQICKPAKMKQPLDLTELGERITKVKVKSGGGPSSVRAPVEKEHPLPLVGCMMKRHETTKNLYHYLGDMRSKKRDETRKLLSL